MKTLTEILADFALNVTFESLPALVVSKAKLEILDTLGAMFGGAQTHSGRVLCDYILNQGGRAGATIAGAGQKVPAVNAALANGTLAFILGVDSGEHSSLSHISAPTLPALMATAEERDISGAKIIAAFVAGYEVAVRIGRAMQPSHRHQGFWSISTFPTFGGAVAAGLALGLDQEALVSALALAGLQASGLGEIETAGTMGRQFMVGKSAHGAAIAAQLAEAGFNGPRTILEGEKGFYAAMATEYDPELITEGLGESFLILNTYNKPYPSCRYSHVVLDALFELMLDHPLTPENVELIRVRTNSITYDVCRSSEPRDFWGEPSPILSLPLTLALAVTQGNFDHGDQVQHSMQILDPDVRALAGRVKLVIDPELDRQPLDRRGCRLDVITKSGESLSIYTEIAKGDPANPMTLEEVSQKYLLYATPVIGGNAAEELFELVANLEMVESWSKVARLTALSSVGAPKHEVPMSGKHQEMN